MKVPLVATHYPRTLGGHALSVSSSLNRQPPAIGGRVSRDRSVLSCQSYIDAQKTARTMQLPKGMLSYTSISVRLVGTGAELSRAQKQDHRPLETERDSVHN